jgi:hypothetical protein
MREYQEPIFDLEGCYWAYSEQKGTLRMNERASTVKAFTANTVTANGYGIRLS